jgi:hypothetical protein
MTAATTSGRAAMIAHLSDVAGASGAYGTTNISVSEGVAVTHEHRSCVKLSYLIVKIKFNFRQLARIHKCPILTSI